ncbi:MAG: hypothetical protein ACJ8BW_11715 [Ktedonobacteraceae bacterium]
MAGSKAGFKEIRLTNFRYSLADNTEGIYEPRDPVIPKDLDDTKTMIIKLAMQLDYKTYDYILYLDNLFTSVPLLKALRKISIGATGTTRKNTKGVSKRLLSLKQNNRDLIWGSTIAEENDGVLVFLWQDNNAVIGRYLPSNCRL